MCIRDSLKLIGAAQAIANDDLAAGGHGPEAVFLRAAQVLQRILAAARVQGVDVYKRQGAGRWG